MESILNLNLKQYIPIAIEAYTHIYGEEYRQIITERLKKTRILEFYDLEGILDYISQLEDAKLRELCLSFLLSVGEDVGKCNNGNYYHRLSKKINKKIARYMYSPMFPFNEILAPLKIYFSDKVKPEDVKKTRIKLINYLNKGGTRVTQSNYDEFIQSEEYKKVFRKILRCRYIYETIELKYKHWRENESEPLREFYWKECGRKNDLSKKYSVKLLESIKLLLPKKVRSEISKLDSKNKMCDAIFGRSGINTKTNLERFSEDDMNALKNKSVPLFSKILIIEDQMAYLESFGIPKLQYAEPHKMEETDIEEYLKMLDEHKDLIPSQELINATKKNREKYLKECTREFNTTRKDFKDALDNFSENSENYESLYTYMNNKNICITGGGGRIWYEPDHDEFFSIMCFTLRDNCFGVLFYDFMHECGHVIDQVEPAHVGFEICDDYFIGSEKNPYNKRYRLHERLNECITDMFAMEAVDYVHEWIGYPIEPKSITKLDVSDENTFKLVKDLLKPFVRKYRKEIIAAKIYGTEKEFISYIGVENYEELNDIINSIDRLCAEGLRRKMKTNPTDKAVKDYEMEVERLKEVYYEIDFRTKGNRQRNRKKDYSNE